MPVYLIYLSVFFALPVILLGWWQRGTFRRYKRTLFWCLFFVYTLGGIWDWLSVRTGVWFYDSAPTLGIWLDGLPMEEFIGFYVFGTLLFFLTVQTFLHWLNRP